MKTSSAQIWTKKWLKDIWLRIGGSHRYTGCTGGRCKDIDVDQHSCLSIWFNHINRSDETMEANRLIRRSLGLSTVVNQPQPPDCLHYLSSRFSYFISVISINTLNAAWPRNMQNYIFFPSKSRTRGSLNMLKSKSSVFTLILLSAFIVLKSCCELL